MASTYVGEIRMFGGNFAPAGWMFCEGQLLPISENETLFNLIGTTYGGDGQSTFALPDLRGRVPLHQGTSSQGNTYTLAQQQGAETVTLTENQLPAHNHPLLAAGGGATDTNPTGRLLATPKVNIYQDPAGEPPPVSMHAQAFTPTGGSQPHSNMQPYLCVNFIISLFGVFPSQG